MYVCLCSVSPVASCSHGRVVRLTVCEADDASSNPALRSFFSIYFFLFLIEVPLLGAIAWCHLRVRSKAYSASSHKRGAFVGFWRDRAANVCLASVN